MTTKEFNKRIAAFDWNAATSENKLDDLRPQFKNFAKYGFQGVFVYANWCERNFEANLREDYERKTTFTSDFSIAEWCYYTKDGLTAIKDTLKNALTCWKDNVEYFAELIIAINMKAWEHAARGNHAWGNLYSELYYFVREMYFDWYDDKHKDHGKAMDYYFDYVD